jgi:hypothetical protein
MRPRAGGPNLPLHDSLKIPKMEKKCFGGEANISKFPVWASGELKFEDGGLNSAHYLCAKFNCFFSIDPSGNLSRF